MRVFKVNDLSVTVGAVAVCGGTANLRQDSIAQPTLPCMHSPDHCGAGASIFDLSEASATEKEAIKAQLQGELTKAQTPQNKQKIDQAIATVNKT